MVFPFGLEAMPPPPNSRCQGPWPGLCQPRAGADLPTPAGCWRLCARLAAAGPGCATGGGQRRLAARALQRRRSALGLADRVRFVGRLDAAAQAGWYARAHLVPEPAGQRFGVGVGAGGDGPRLHSHPVGPAGQPRAGAPAATTAGSLPGRACPRRPTWPLRDLAPTPSARPTMPGWPARLFAPAVQAFLARLRALAPASTCHEHPLPQPLRRQPGAGHGVPALLPGARMGARRPPVQMVAADFSHVRARQPQARASESSTASPTAGAHAALPGQRAGPGEEHLGLPAPGVGGDARLVRPFSRMW
jgi:hypothetical protein